MPRPDPALSRRAAIAAGLGVAAVAVTGCGTRSSPAPASAPAADDAALVETVGTAIAAALARAEAAERVAAVRPLARALAAMHRAHLERLEVDERTGDATEAPGAVSDPTAVRTRLLAGAERLQRELVSAALEARSGALAQTFASMGAAVAQQRAVAG